MSQTATRDTSLYMLAGAGVPNSSPGPRRSVLVAAAQGCVLFGVIGGFPTSIWPCRDAILDLCAPAGKRGAAFSMLTKRLLTTAIIWTGTVVSFLVDDLGAVIEIIGAVGGCYTVPARPRLVLPSGTVAAMVCL